MLCGRYTANASLRQDRACMFLPERASTRRNPIPNGVMTIVRNDTVQGPMPVRASEEITEAALTTPMRTSLRS